MFTNDIFRLGHYLAQGLRHLELGAETASAVMISPCATGRTRLTTSCATAIVSGAVELFFDFASDLDGERKGGRAEQHMAPWHRDLILH